MITSPLPSVHRWLRIADADWADPTDPSWAATSGGRWNPPGSWGALYLNEDMVTARCNTQLRFDDLPFGPEDVVSGTGPVLAVLTLPRDQQVCDMHSPAGVAAVGLPPTYPLDAPDGDAVPHEVCQGVGRRVHDAGLRGVRCRSAQTVYGAGRELAWFPATARSRATVVEVLAFEDWFWS